MLQFGMPTLIELPDIEDCAKLCHELGLQFIELNMNLPQYQIECINITELKRISVQYDIYYTIHLDENLNVSDFNPHVAKAYLRTVRETISLAEKLNVPVLNMHLAGGVYFTLPDRRVFLFDEYRDRYLKSIVQFRDACEKAIGKSDIRICVENCDGYTDFQNQALDILLDSKVFSLTFDIGHNHGIGGYDESVILSRKNKLCHFHFHDALGKKNHLALGTGEIDLKKYLSMAGENNCSIVLETKTVNGLKQSVKWLRECNI